MPFSTSISTSFVGNSLFSITAPPQKGESPHLKATDSFELATASSENPLQLQQNGLFTRTGEVSIPNDGKDHGNGGISTGELVLVVGGALLVGIAAVKVGGVVVAGTVAALSNPLTLITLGALILASCQPESSAEYAEIRFNENMTHGGSKNIILPEKRTINDGSDPNQPITPFFPCSMNGLPLAEEYIVSKKLLKEEGLCPNWERLLCNVDAGEGYAFKNECLRTMYPYEWDDPVTGERQALIELATGEETPFAQTLETTPPGGGASLRSPAPGSPLGRDGFTVFFQPSPDETPIHLGDHLTFREYVASRDNVKLNQQAAVFMGGKITKPMPEATAPRLYFVPATFDLETGKYTPKISPSEIDETLPHTDNLNPIAEVEGCQIFTEIAEYRKKESCYPTECRDAGGLLQRLLWGFKPERRDGKFRQMFAKNHLETVGVTFYRGIVDERGEVTRGESVAPDFLRINGTRCRDRDPETNTYSNVCLYGSDSIPTPQSFVPGFMNNDLHTPILIDMETVPPSSGEPRWTPEDVFKIEFLVCEHCEDESMVRNRSGECIPRG